MVLFEGSGKYFTDFLPKGVYFPQKRTLGPTVCEHLVPGAPRVLIDLSSQTRPIRVYKLGRLTS